MTIINTFKIYFRKKDFLAYGNLSQEKKDKVRAKMREHLSKEIEKEASQKA